MGALSHLLVLADIVVAGCELLRWEDWDRRNLEMACIFGCFRFNLDRLFCVSLHHFQVSRGVLIVLHLLRVEECWGCAVLSHDEVGSLVVQTGPLTLIVSNKESLGWMTLLSVGQLLLN